VTDLEFFFDPVCPFCWVTSQWLRKVQHQRGLDIDWRFLSLSMLNEGQYEDKPEGYPGAHHRGLEMLRVAAAARASHGPGVVGNLYEAMGKAVWHADGSDGSDVSEFTDVLAHSAQAGDLRELVTSVGLPADLAEAVDDPDWDGEIRADTDEALERVGGDAGTPIMSFQPPDGPAFFGPIISEVPSDEEAGELFDAVRTLAEWPSFAELKRSLRHFPSTPLTASLAGDDTQVS
jgi:2-hydroxychromene-2-carboxylate isomerase